MYLGLAQLPFLFLFSPFGEKPGIRGKKTIVHYATTTREQHACASQWRDGDGEIAETQVA